MTKKENQQRIESVFCEVMHQAKKHQYEVAEEMYGQVVIAIEQEFGCPVEEIEGYAEQKRKLAGEY